MRLTAMHVSGLKNLTDLDIPIPPLLAIQGPNGSGKSAVLEAVQIGLYGALPVEGKRTVAAVRALMAGDEAEVRLTFGDDLAVLRRLAPKTDLVVSAPGRVIGARTLADKEAAIRAATGLFAPSFNVADFLALSPEKKLDALFTMLPRAGELDLDEATWRETWKDAPSAAKKHADYVLSHLRREPNKVEALAQVIYYVHERLKEAERERQTLKKIVGDSPGPPPAAPKPEQIEHAQNLLSDVQRQRGAWNAANQAARVNEGERRLRKRHFEEVEAERGRIKRLIGEIEASLQGPPPSEDEIREEREKLADLNVQIEGAQAKAVTEFGKASQIQVDLSVSARKAALIENALVCPVCGMKEGVAAAQEHYENEAERLREQLAEQQKISDAATTDLNRLRQERDATDRRHDHLTHAADAIATARGSLAAHKERWAALTAEANRLAEEAELVIQSPDRAENEGLAAEEHKLRDEIERLLNARAATEGAVALHRKAQADTDRLAVQGAVCERLADLLSVLGTWRANVMSRMLQPIQESAERLLHSIDPGKHFEFRWEPSFDFGFCEGDNSEFRSYRSASNGEAAFLSVVLVAALVRAVDPPWKVLMVDNVEAVDSERRDRLLYGLVGAGFDNVILAGCCSYGEVEPLDTDRARGWTILDMGAAVASQGSRGI